MVFPAGTPETGETFELKFASHVTFQPLGNVKVNQGGDDGDDGPGTDDEGGENSEKKKVKLLQTNCGCTVGVGHWLGDTTELVWTCMWKASGLMPVRPTITFSQNGSIAGGHALAVHFKAWVSWHACSV